MQDQAASAALASSGHKQSGSNGVLDADGKLSSASAATSLKYAKAQDLPSYPSTGGVKMSSAGAAASLANNNKKSVDLWKPGEIPAANKAALLAKDHKMDPLWKPEASAAGSKAAMMAAAHPTQVEPLQPKSSTTVKSVAPSAAYDTPENTHRKALMAAAAVTKRNRSGSLPTQPVAKPNDNASWAMKAATQSHKAGPPAPLQPFASGDPGFEAARIQNVAKSNVDRQLYTSSPPVAIEVQEKNRQDTLRASAVAMAQKMYAMQQKHIDEAAGKSAGDSQALAASRARGTTMGSSTGSVSEDHPTVGAGYENLEEAARRLAQERLAKIHDEHAEYRSYYGATSPPKRSSMSLRMSRRHASSAADDDSDEEQSRKIRSQMSIFQSKLADVDTKKRQQDRDNLLQIAHRNVDAQMSKMDGRVFEDTGKASPAQTEKWEKAAREKAQRDSDERMQYTGKVHIGGGKYLDQSELDAIAKARLQPTLDDISEKAEKQRARDEELRLERERKLEQERREKARSAETAAQVKADLEKQKQEERTRKDKEKAAHKSEQAAEKQRARLEKEEQRKSKDNKHSRLSTLFGRGGAATGAGGAAAAASSHEDRPTTIEPQATSETSIEGETFYDQVTSPTSATTSTSPKLTRVEPAAASPADTQAAPTVPEKKSTDERRSTENRSSIDKEDVSSSPKQSGVKSWMKVRFRSKSNAQKETTIMPAVVETDANADKVKTVDQDNAVPRIDSMRDVAMAGRTTTNETDDMYTAGKDVSPERSIPNNATRSRSTSISSLSSDREHEQEHKPNTDFSLGTTEPEPAPVPAESEDRGRPGFAQRLMDKIMPSASKEKTDESMTPVTTSKSNESDDEFEEARDNFEEEKLAPPPPLSSLTGEGNATTGKTVSPRGSREGSRFTEEL
ncbi:Eisosome assembly protein [Knufia obscura]|uniref:Eisosome assembly protein n=1 Tax=Knufia obscura TaxID=1635080 RepID=A0ABR0RTN3_9EURO|nr:Eisosome assembly protein [Knufia obscura]